MQGSYPMRLAAPDADADSKATFAYRNEKLGEERHIAEWREVGLTVDGRLSSSQLAKRADVAARPDSDRSFSSSSNSLMGHRDYIII